MTTATQSGNATATKRIRAVDVAREAGVSRAAVGFVINNTPGIAISDATRERILEAARRLGYRPNAAASALARGRSNVVLLVLPDWPLDHILGRHISEAERVLAEAGLHLITSTQRATSSAKPVWEVIAPDVVIGLMPFSHEEIAAFHATGIARVVPARNLQVTDNPYFVLGPRCQVEHLVCRGHELIGYVGTADPHMTGLSELRGSIAATAAGEHGAKLVDVVTADIETDLSDVLSQWHAAGITGVVAYNDEIAAVVLKAARRAGLAVPDQLAVIGHDDTPLARLVSPELTSVSYDVTGLGQLVADLAVGAIPEDFDVTSVLTSPTLVQREST